MFLALMIHRPLGDKSSVSGKKMGKKYEKEKNAPVRVRSCWFYILFKMNFGRLA